MYFRSPYIQKGYGIGGIFRGIANFFRPVARNVVKVLNKPGVKKVLKTMGRETMDTGSELLLDSLRGSDVQSRLNDRVNVAKNRIADSVKEGINDYRNRKKYRRLYDNEEEEEEELIPPTYHKPRLYLKNRSSSQKNSMLKKYPYPIES